jgi:multiple sugar transport system permease protein
MSTKKITVQIKKNLGGWLIMIPSILLFIFFIWVPLFSNISLSFYETVGYSKETFVGFDKYKEVFADPVFIKAFINTLKYTFWSIVIGFVIPIILALILSEVIHLKGLFRTAIYFPNIVPGLATVLMWTFLMDPAEGGVLNSILANFGMGPKPWLNDPSLVIPLIVLTMTWKGAGATTLIYLATVQGIDDTYYEASRIEGASIWQRIRYITIPHLLPTIRMLFILQIINVFQVFYEPMVMTGGGPDNASISLLQLIYNYAFKSGDAAKAAALGVIVAMMLFVLTIVYLKISKKADHN